MLTPEGHTKFASLKREVSNLSDAPTPQKAKPFLDWRVKILQNEVLALECLREQYKESWEKELITDGSEYNSLRDGVEEELGTTETELAQILKQGQFLREDMQDSSAEFITTAYMEELYTSFGLTGEKGQKANARKLKYRNWSRKDFRAKVSEYLGVSRQEAPTAASEAWCVALGRWLPHGMVKCAHIVPFAFDTKELSYMFGVEDAALKSEKNGLFLNKVIEAGFDSGWIAIVPHESVEKSPTEWKIVLLNEKVRPNTVYTAPGCQEVIRWGVSSLPFSFCLDILA
jgi:hypothetical protein